MFATRQWTEEFWTRAAPTDHALDVWSSCVDGCASAMTAVRARMTSADDGTVITLNWDANVTRTPPRLLGVDGGALRCRLPATRTIPNQTSPGRAIRCRWQPGHHATSVIIRTTAGDLTRTALRPSSGRVRVVVPATRTETRQVCGAQLITPFAHEARCDSNGRCDRGQARGEQCVLCEGRHRFCYLRRTVSVSAESGWTLVPGTASLAAGGEGAGFNCADRFRPPPDQRCAGHSTEQFSETSTTATYTRSYTSHPVSLTLCAQQQRQVPNGTREVVSVRVWDSETFVVVAPAAAASIEFVDSQGLPVEAVTVGESLSRLTLVGAAAASRYTYRLNPPR